jgi:stalled ribosome alternative rescue factor ArfA
MSANASTGVLDTCLLRISVRKEIKGGGSFQVSELFAKTAFFLAYRILLFAGSA